jgi:hypothetical protein
MGAGEIIAWRNEGLPFFLYPGLLAIVTQGLARHA